MHCQQSVEFGIIAFVGEPQQTTMCTVIFRTQSAHGWLLLFLAVDKHRPTAGYQIRKLV
jgi:hypothetical protein